MTLTGNSLNDQTGSWCQRAEEAIREEPAGAADCRSLVREGILLRRRWDLAGPDSVARCRLLRLLPAVQNLCHERLVDWNGGDAAAAAELGKLLLEQLVEDERYLAELFDSPGPPSAGAALAIESFRDDLHWLETQAAILDDHQGVDFLGRILLEQQTLEREIAAWEERIATKSAGDGLPLNHHGQPPAADTVADMENGPPATSPQEVRRELDEAIAKLKSAAGQLRVAAIVRQIETLLSLPEPEDWQGWYQVWQAASRLEARLQPESPQWAATSSPCVPGGAPASESLLANEVSNSDSRETDEAANPGSRSASGTYLRDQLAEFRRRASARWVQQVLELPPTDRRKALCEITENLADVTGETLTFLEELPLPEGVRSLEVLAEDLATSRFAATKNEEQYSAGPQGKVDRQWISLKRSLRRREAAVAGELQDRRLAWRMEHLFGRRAVAALERSILALLVVFVVLLAVEGPLLRYEAEHWGTGPLHSGNSRIEPMFAWIDLGICLVLLAEFGLKMGLSQRRWLYWKRNWITGFVPSIPVGFLLYAVHQLSHANTLLLAEESEWIVLLRLLRYLRLPQMARWLRVARPVLRVARLAIFTLRASDRLVRQLSPLLNRNLVLFERAAISVEEPAHRTALAALRERFYRRAAEFNAALPRTVRCRLIQARIEDLTAMLTSPPVGRKVLFDSCGGPSLREIPLEGIVARLITVTPASLSEGVGRGVAESVARWCRAFDMFGIRRLPLLRDLVSASRLPTPYETTARVANRIGLVLQEMLERVYWVADLYGTVTAPQLVDSLGEWLVKGTARPARRFLIFGAAFLLVSYLASLLQFSALSVLSQTLQRFLGTPLIIMGTICLVPLFVGIWFRQIANEATDFYTQVAEAQFIRATRILKHRLAKRNRALLNQRVLMPEMAIHGDDVATGSTPGGDRFAAEHTAVVSEAIELLWQDYLEGPPFHSSDIGTTNQLLGNLVLISLRETRLSYHRRARARLRQLDLSQARATFRGPYVWFHFVSRSLAQHTAKLIVDYNAFALPLSRSETAGDAEIYRYVEWLSRRLKVPADRLELPEPFLSRYRAMSPARKSAERRRARSFHSNDFTALHFLAIEPQLEEDIRRRYGDQLADLMRRDRRDNVRRVLRTYPLHRLPKEQRTFNPLALYQRHCSGGRVLLLPLKITWWAAVLAALVLRQIWRFVREVLQPSVGDLSGLDDPDPFAVAVRKIHRMRKPLFLECLRMRAQFDPEYLGIILPGSQPRLRGLTAAGIEDDLQRIEAGPSLKDEFHRLASKRRRQVLEFRSWLTRFQLHDRSSQALRAMAIAYTVDFEGIRGRLAATRMLRRAMNDALAVKPCHWSLEGLPSWSLRAAWCRLRYRRRLLKLFEQPAFAGFDEDQQRRCRRLVYCRRGELLRALQVLTGPGAPADPVEHAREVLSCVGQDPAPWSRQLVILRAVQTLSVLDLQTYCDQVYELGEYGQCSPATEPQQERKTEAETVVVSVAPRGVASGGDGVMG